jgi:hypothetical protein
MWRGSLELACSYVPASLCGEGMFAIVAELLG